MRRMALALHPAHHQIQHSMSLPQKRSWLSMVPNLKKQAHQADSLNQVQCPHRESQLPTIDKQGQSTRIKMTGGTPIDQL